MIRTLPFALLLISCFFVLNPANAQREVIGKKTADSLLRIITENPEKDKSIFFNKLARYYYSFDEDSAALMTKKALEEAKKHQNISEKAYAYKNAGNMFMHKNQPDSAFQYYAKATDFFLQEGDENGLSAVYNNIGVIHKTLSQYDLALKYFSKAGRLLKKTEADATSKAALYSNLAGTHYLKSQPEQGLAYLDSAYALIEEIPENYMKGVIYSNLGKFFTSMERYDKALTMLQNAEEIFSPEKDKKMTAIVYNNLGEVYREIYNYNRAENYFNKVLEISSSNQDSLSMALAMMNVADILYLRKAYEEARQKLLKAQEIYSSIGNQPALIETVLTIAKTYAGEDRHNKGLTLLEEYEDALIQESNPGLLHSYYGSKHELLQATGNYEKAYKALNLFHRYSDTVLLNKHNASEHVLKKELEMAGNEMQRNIEHENEQAAAKAKSQAIFLYIALALLVIVLILALWLFYREKQKRKKSDAEYALMKSELEKAREKQHDIDKDIEDKVKKRTEELQKQIDAYKKKDVQLKKTLKEVEDANYLKNAFLSNMSHEIRTPLNGIIGFSSLLETELSLLENEELYGYASGIQQSGERLLHLLNNIIDISRIEANDLQVTLQESNINQLIEKSAEIYKYQAGEKDLSLNIKLEDTPMAYVDPDSVTKILSDVLDNAVKYTEKGFINVTNGYDAKKKEVFVKVRDTGIGIDEQYLPKVFEAFRQESLGYSRAFQGAGLGLPLAKRLLDLMNGRIDIESKKSEGTTVIIYLPTKETFQHVQESLHPTKDNKQADEQTKAPKDVRIFLVEDDRMNRLVINKMLSDWKVDDGEDGDVSIAKISEAHKQGIIYDIMLFDINLPNPWDGVKLMHYIKKKFPEYENIPFIAQTAYAMRGDRERLLEEGFDDYMSKPISQQRLLTTLYKFLNKENDA
ncbi:MAG: tetratricopeptide repeat protein [Bacteroidota bacterium]